MTSHRQTLDLPFWPEDMFDLASDVGRYPEFIPWIKTLRVLDWREDEGRMSCRAEATVGFGGFRETFVTDVDARKPVLAIDVTLVRGPFRKLSNTWRFHAIPTGVRVDFAIQFEFRNFVLHAFADANKNHAVREIINAFVTEAGRRYEKVETSV